MAPDLNSLPPSRSPSGSNSPHQTRMPSSTSVPSQEGAAAAAAAGNQPASPSPLTANHSLAAAATVNAGIHQESRRSSNGSIRNRGMERRRSSMLMNIAHNDPTLPGPGELQQGSPRQQSRQSMWPADPHHHRAPSLGEIHQELENEQEAQVNRLLNMIRLQQAQIQAIQASRPGGSGDPSSAIDDTTPSSERSISLPQSASSTQPTAPLPNLASSSLPRSRSPLPISRQSSYRSRGSSHAGSPALRPMSAGLGTSAESHEWMLPGAPAGSRDESAFYQAETQMLARENQMLKMRIRELERQLSDLNPTSQVTHAPVTHSNLVSRPLADRTPSSAAEATSSSTQQAKEE